MEEPCTAFTTNESSDNSLPSSESYWAKLKIVAKVELQYLTYKKIYIGLFLAGLMQYVHVVCHNYVFFLAAEHGVSGGKSNKLVDMGFLGTDHLMAMDAAPNFCLYILTAISIAFSFSVFFTRIIVRDPRIHTFQMIWRACVCSCFTITLRCISFMITILPSPADHCAGKDWNPPKNAADIFTWFDVGGGCSDLLFSSHMMYGILCTLAVTHYMILGMRGSVVPITTTEKWLKYAAIFACWAIVFWEGFSIIRQQVHYSIDVFTSGYAVPLCWIAFYHFVPNDPVPPSQRNAEKAELH